MSRMILTVILFLGVIALGIFYVWPQGNQYIALRKDTAALERILEELDRAREMQTALAEKIDSVARSDIERIKAAIPKGANEETLIRTFDSYGAQAGVIVQSLKFAAAEAPVGAGAQSNVPRPVGAPEFGAPSGMRELRIAIEVAGTYQNMKRFLDLLERHIRIIDVEYVSFPPIVSPAEVFPFSIQAVTYYYQ